MNRWRIASIAFVVLALAGTVALAGCSSAGDTGGSGGTPSPTTPNTVVEKNIEFQPSMLTVKVGDTVTFDNQDTVPHNVEIDGRALGEQAAGDKVTWKAENAGTFPYSCIIHPSMAGTIKVQ